MKLRNNLLFRLWVPARSPARPTTILPASPPIPRRARNSALACCGRCSSRPLHDRHSACQRADRARDGEASSPTRNRFFRVRFLARWSHCSLSPTPSTSPPISAAMGERSPSSSAARPMSMRSIFSSVSVLLQVFVPYRLCADPEMVDACAVSLCRRRVQRVDPVEGSAVSDRVAADFA